MDRSPKSAVTSQLTGQWHARASVAPRASYFVVVVKTRLECLGCRARKCRWKASVDVDSLSKRREVRSADEACTRGRGMKLRPSSLSLSLTLSLCVCVCVCVCV